MQNRMDITRYYSKKPDGSYLVHFPNHEGLSLEEVTEQFAQFGEVLSADNRNKPCGLCYVRYKSEEDAIHCIEGFRNHKTISILPHKKQPQVKDWESPKKKEQSDSQGSVKSDSNSKKKQDSFRRMSGIPALMSLTSKYGSKTKEYTNKNEHSSPQGSVKSDSNLKQKNNDFKRKSNITPLNKQESISRSGVSSRADSIIEDHISVKDFMDPLPSLSKTEESVNLAPEVVVANIPIKYGIHYILHLFEKYNPIGISLMKVIVSSKIRYCHVYFSSWEKAFATQKELDEYLLGGRNLVVLTTPNLVREALAA